jgi:hypothetical protein
MKDEKVLIFEPTTKPEDPSVLILDHGSVGRLQERTLTVQAFAFMVVCLDHAEAGAEPTTLMRDDPVAFT